MSLNARELGAVVSVVAATVDAVNRELEALGSPPSAELERCLDRALTAAFAALPDDDIRAFVQALARERRDPVGTPARDYQDAALRAEREQLLERLARKLSS